MKKRQSDGIQVVAGPLDLDAAVLLRRLSPALLVIGIWIAWHPYKGIVHDSRLYVTQIFRSLYPDIFESDLFFAFGSQDDFTLFARLCAPLVAYFGPSAATMMLVALSHALWLSGAAALALRFAPNRRAAVVGLALLSCMPAFYGGWHVIAFGEGFATPRLTAEGLALWALWALTSHRLGSAAGLVFVTGLLHPLVAATVLCVGLCFLSLRDWRWVALGLAGLVAAAMLAYAGVLPFDRLSQTMDSEWLAILKQRNTYLFPALWRPVDWSQLAVAAAATSAGAIVLTDWRRRLLLAGAIAGIGGLVVSHVGTDVLHNVFLTQIQLWRTLWLLHVLGYLSAGILFVRLWELKDDGLPLIALIVLLWVIDRMLYPGYGAIVGVLAFGLAVLRLRGVLQPFTLVFRVASVTLIGLAIALLFVCRVVYVAKRMTTVPGVDTFLEAFGSTSVIEAATAGAVAVLLLRFRPSTARRILPVAAVILAIASAAAWDRRDASARTFTGEHPIPAFESALPADAQVYWEGDVRGAWLLLRRPSYFSFSQGAGNVFHRRTALAFRDRAGIIYPLMGRELINHYHTFDDVPPPLPALTRSMLVDACRRDRALDAMVLSRAVPGAYAAEWELPAPLYEERAAKKGVARPPIRRVYLYRCDDLI